MTARRRAHATQLEKRILELVTERAPKTACPSEVARSEFGASWRGHMDDVREAAARLADRGALVVTQRGVAVDVRSARGPVRLGLP